MAYLFYLDKVLLPIAPSKVSMKINNQNKTVNLINEGQINIIKDAGLTSINFDVLLPQVNYPFASYKKGFVAPSYFLEKFEEFKTGKEPISFKIVRTFPNGKMLFDTNMNVALEDYQIVENATNGFDLTVTITLKQYRPYGTKKFTVKGGKASVEKKRSTKNSPQPKVTSKTYTVQKGDCLWTIAKKFYGDGSKYTKIYNVNKDKIKNPNLIYVGQKLVIPV